MPWVGMPQPAQTTLHIGTRPVCANIIWAGQMPAQDEGCCVSGNAPCFCREQAEAMYRRGVCHLPSEACKAQKQWLPS